MTDDIVDRLKNTSLVHHEAIDEITTLRAKLECLSGLTNSELCNAVEAERDRYKVALTEIVNAFPVEVNGYDMWQIARAALKMTCKKCNGEMRLGQALEQTLISGSPDFPGDKVGITMSAGGPGKLVDCMKCSDCGWSIALC